MARFKAGGGGDDGEAPVKSSRCEKVLVNLGLEGEDRAVSVSARWTEG